MSDCRGPAGRPRPPASCVAPGAMASGGRRQRRGAARHAMRPGPARWVFPTCARPAARFRRVDESDEIAVLTAAYPTATFDDLVKLRVPYFSTDERSADAATTRPTGRARWRAAPATMRWHAASARDRGRARRRARGRHRLRVRLVHLRRRGRVRDGHRGRSRPRGSHPRPQGLRGAWLPQRHPGAGLRPDLPLAADVVDLVISEDVHRARLRPRGHHGRIGPRAALREAASSATRPTGSA